MKFIECFESAYSERKLELKDAQRRINRFNAELLDQLLEATERGVFGPDGSASTQDEADNGCQAWLYKNKGNVVVDARLSDSILDRSFILQMSLEVAKTGKPARWSSTYQCEFDTDDNVDMAIKAVMRSLGTGLAELEASPTPPTSSQYRDGRIHSAFTSNASI